ncbi:MAG: D-aminoacylase [Gemmatimonadetes bacterium]|nr:D-aminoacylase [Gemmatimonadota bacterium]
MGTSSAWAQKQKKSGTIWGLVRPAALLTALLMPACSSPDTGGERYDIVLRGGRVIDGTGGTWFYADVGVRDGRIAAVGDLNQASAAEVIDATGRVVTPGFIDMHTHSDFSLLRDGRGLSKIRQGVTTEILGEGSSVAPRKPGAGGGGYGIEADWTTLRGYFERLESSGTSGNVMSYIGAGQLRRYVMGEGVQRKPTAEELEEMKRLLDEGMKDGAVGLVMALETPGQEQLGPEGRPSDAVPGTQELIELAKVTAPYGGIYGTHMRDQGAHIVEAIEEAATIGEQGGVRVEIFHLKAAGRPNFGKMGQALAAIEAARRRGVDIAADVYPYIAASHGLSTEIPRWAHEGGTEKFLARLADPELRPRIKREVTQYMNTKYYNETTGASGFNAVIVASVPKNPEQYVGKTLGEIAREQGKAPDDLALDLFIEQGGDVGIVMFYMSEKDVQLALRHPLLSFDSDGTAASPDFGGKPHPRWYGTFPRVLGHYVRDLGVGTLEDVVRRMTSLPAQRMGLLDRGLIRPGMWADLVVFDPARVNDRATFDNPHQFPEGIGDVIVNGVVVIRNGEHTGALPGRALFGRGRTDTGVARQARATS